MDQSKSRTKQLIEELMRQLDPASPRYHVLASARQFKSSWVDLGDKLTRVQRKQLYREWGYAAFEDYCSKEIRIRRQTALKLTQAYRYLEQEAPDCLGDDPHRGRAAPDFRAVDLLRQASENPGFDETSLAELRRAVLEEQLSPLTVRRQFNRVIEGTASAADAQRRNLDLALQTARRLRAALEPLPELAGELPALLERFESRVMSRLEASATSPDLPATVTSR